jgi:hypothetical protein
MRFVILDDDNVVVSVRFGTKVVGEEVQNDTADIGDTVEE